ncbi:kinesin-like protein KIF6 [Styela clava]
MSSKNSKRNGGKTISTFCRIRPPISNARLQTQIWPSYDDSSHTQLIQFTKPTDVLLKSNSAKEKETQKFAFNEIFDENVLQAEIFQTVGRPIIDYVLNGYNGTVFAHGQTATGKTYTIMGEELEYEADEECGIIPRSIDYIFKDLKAKGDPFEVQVSFLEIYQKKMYDLLGAESYSVNHKTFLSKREVICRMRDTKVELENLALRKVETSDETLDVFLEGNSNREIAQTYANNRSSRSHVVFTVYIKREDDTGVVESKLHFVDLAGSERVGKDQLGDSLLVSEAKDINRSLLFLHKVIQSIANNSQPETFRNTMITKILRDSLVGNSVTSLVATISIDEHNLDETLSTCNFAQSVSMIKTKPKLNQIEDLNLIIARLQEENIRLNSKLDELQRSKINDPLTEEEVENLKQMVLNYFNDNDSDAFLDVLEDDIRVQFCFNELKELGRGYNSELPTEIESQQKKLTDKEMRDLNVAVEAFIADRREFAELDYGGNTESAQYCLQRLKYLVKEMGDSNQTKKKGCC